MPPREPATAEQLADVLRRDIKDSDLRVIPPNEAIQAVAHSLRIEPTRAHEWLTTATTRDPNSPVLMVRIQRGGHAQTITRANSEPFTRPRARSDRLLETTFKQNGIIECNSVRVDADGYHYLAAVDGAKRKAMGACAAFVLASTLDQLAARAAADEADRRAANDADRRARDALIEERHGESLGYLRGLLALANLGQDNSFSGLHTYAGQHGSIVTIELCNADIDGVADVLRRLGIKSTKR